MNDDDRLLLTENLRAMNELNAEMREFRCETKWFRAEMNEFKTQTVLRIRALEETQNDCQKNPTVCATARNLEAHTRNHATGKSFAVALWAVCVSTAMCVFSLVMAFIKRS